MTLDVARGIIIAGLLLGGLWFALAGITHKDQLTPSGPFLVIGGLSLIGIVAVFVL